MVVEPPRGWQPLGIRELFEFRDLFWLLVGRDIKVLSHKPSEMGFLDSSALTKSDIFEGFGVNPISAGQVEHANRASSAVADRHLCANTVNPIIETMSQVMTKWVARSSPTRMKR